MPSRHTRRGVLVSAGSLWFAGCSAPTTDRDSTPTQTPPPLSHDSSEYDPDWESPTDSPLSTPVEPTVLVENLEIPWDLDFTPDGDVFLTERVGRVRRFDGDELSTVATPSDAINAGSLPPGSDEQPWWVEGGEGGVMGIAVHPAYPDPSFIYVYYTARVRGGKENRLVRYDPDDSRPADTETTLLSGIPAHRVHNGGRLTFGPENYLWVTTGDAEIGDRTQARSQDLGSLAGKLLRLTPDGDPAPTNPDFDGSADPRIVSYGHRNPQGLSWLPDGTPIVSEHGQDGYDEVNVIRAGANYGWPSVRRPADHRSNPDVQPPVASSLGTSWAPSGAVFYTGDGIPAWNHRFIIGGLGSQQVIIVTLSRPDDELPPTGADGARVHDGDWLDESYVATSHPTLQDALGRVRLVTQSPDGGLYAITSNRDGRARGEFPREVDDVLVRLELQ